MKITVIGGGSYCWTPTLFRDVLFTPGLEGSEIVLEDINPKHLADLHKCCKVILAQTKKTRKFKLTATTDETKALRGADFVILTITTGGYDAMQNDVEIPYRYGIYQPVGDSVGPGGLSRALRNIPVVVGIAKKMERLCPDAWFINITNPMSVITRSVRKETSIRSIGLCHELYGTLSHLQTILGGTDWRTDFDCVVAGVNHLPWILKLRFKGQDAFPLLLKRLKEAKGASKAKAGTALDQTLIGSNQVKFALLEKFGALPASGDRHVVEFFPWFCTEEMRQGAAMGVKLTTLDIRRKEWTPGWQKNVADLTSGAVKVRPVVSREATARVIAALSGAMQWEDVVNLPNEGRIAGLPREAIVETMGFIKSGGAYGLPVGTIPPGVLANIQRFVTNQEMTVEAAVKGDRGLALQVLLNEPLCGAIRDFRQVEKMFDSMLSANRKWLPQFFK